mmetsp:Transcript_14133/g.28821  ORF Transcript_14133/g.28821 Transcript_14133/m.28821 type:complete len:229 (+) Transcript_14133:667-1353(+)
MDAMLQLWRAWALGVPSMKDSHARELKRQHVEVAVVRKRKRTICIRSNVPWWIYMDRSVGSVPPESSWRSMAYLHPRENSLKAVKAASKEWEVDRKFLIWKNTLMGTYAVVLGIVRFGMPRSLCALMRLMTKVSVDRVAPPVESVPNATRARWIAMSRIKPMSTRAFAAPLRRTRFVIIKKFFSQNILKLGGISQMICFLRSLFLTGRITLSMGTAESIPSTLKHKNN